MNKQFESHLKCSPLLEVGVIGGLIDSMLIVCMLIVNILIASFDTRSPFLTECRSKRMFYTLRTLPRVRVFPLFNHLLKSSYSDRPNEFDKFQLYSFSSSTICRVASFSLKFVYQAVCLSSFVYLADIYIMFAHSNVLTINVHLKFLSSSLSPLYQSLYQSLY